MNYNLTSKLPRSLEDKEGVLELPVNCNCELSLLWFPRFAHEIELQI